MATVDLQTLFREKVKSLKAYHVDTVDCEVKLHANENPYEPPEELLRAFQEKLQTFHLNRYPDPDSTVLKQAISKRVGVSSSQLVVGNGSDELIQLILQIFCDEGDAIAFPDPTFAMYGIIAKGLGLNPQTLPLNDRWNFEADSFLKILKDIKARVVFFSYPNNPTGNCFSEKEIQKVIEHFPGIVVLDEAYYDFAQKTFVEEMARHNNLILLRSLSKIGLAALRIGFGVADPRIIEQINKVRLPYNANTISQAFAAQVLNDFTPVQKQIDTILKERNRLMDALSKIEALTVFPSHSNFILFRVDKPGCNVFRKLVENGILIRDLGAHPRLNHCFRVTLGTQEENDRFLRQLKNAAG